MRRYGRDCNIPEDKTRDALKILKKRYGEPSQEARDELAATDLQARLAAACERRGIEATRQEYICADPDHCPHMQCEGEDCPPNCPLNVPETLPVPVLLDRLEVWADTQGLSLVVRRNHWQPHGPWTAAWAVYTDTVDFSALTLYSDEQTARAEAVLQVTEKETP